MTNLPKKIIRLDDGMEFVLNEKTQKYSPILGIPHLDDYTHFHNEYSYEDLMCLPNLFKVSDGTEDVAAMRQKWINEMNRQMREIQGCGGD